MDKNVIEHRGLNELITRMQHFPNKLKEIGELGMQASLLVLWENVPPYPPPPTDSTYRRTGTLGRTLGSSEAGGKSGNTPDVYTVKKLGAHGLEGRFGTNLDYAPYVIGPAEGAKGERQAWMHKGKWWHLTDIIPKAQAKINQIWTGITQKMVDFLNQKSSGAQ